MQHKPEREWDLTIGPDTVRLFILKARAISAGINADYEDGAEHEVELDDQSRESHHHDGLAEEESEDLTERELRELIGDLNVDEAAELVALMWVGRGDYDAGEFNEAIAEAKRRTDIKPVRYLMNRPMLGEWLEEGLEMIGA
ncbi:MAG: DUF3775 domain-containing protein [Mesorhizobium sp.]|nr:DUF3775 domain-containing protein [Mesorhizobium sp.]